MVFDTVTSSIKPTFVASILPFDDPFFHIPNVDEGDDDEGDEGDNIENAWWY